MSSSLNFQTKALFGSRGKHRKNVGNLRSKERRRKGSTSIPLESWPRFHEVEADFWFPVCTVRHIPFLHRFLRKLSCETKGLMTSAFLWNSFLHFTRVSPAFQRSPKWERNQLRSRKEISACHGKEFLPKHQPPGQAIMERIVFTKKAAGARSVHVTMESKRGLAPDFCK